MAIANLLVKIGADIAELKTGSDKAVRVMEQTSSKIDNIGSSIKTTLLASLSVGAVVSFGKELLNMADNIVRTADRTGLLISEVQKLDYIASQSGNSIDELTTGVGQLQNRLASGDKSALAAVKQLGLSFDQLRNASPFEQLGLIAEAVGKIPNPAERAQVAMDLFGKSGIAILPTLISNFKQLANEAPVMSDNTTKALDKAGDELARFGKTAKVWAAESYNYLSTLFDKGTAAIFRFIAGSRAGTASLLETIQKIPGSAKVFGDLSDNIKSLRDSSQYYTDAAKAMDYQIAHAGDTVKKTVPPFDALKTKTEELSEAQKKAKAASDAHAKAIAGLVEQLSGAGAVKAAQDLLEALKKMPPIQNLTAESQKKINDTMGEALDVFRAQGTVAPKAIRDVYEATFKLTDTLPLINRWKEGLAHSADGLLQLHKISDKLATDTWPKTIDGLEKMFIVQGRVIQQTKNLGETLKDSLYKTLLDIPQTIASAFTGGGGIGGAIKSIASTIGSGIGAAIGAAVGGPLGSAIGSALGSLAGVATGALAKLFGIGPTEYEKRMRAAAAETKNLQAQLIAAHGSMEQLIIDAELVGVNIKEAFKWQDPEAFKKIVEEINDKTNLLNAAMQEYGFTWEDLGDKARNAKLSQLFDELYAKTDVLRTAGIDYHTILERQAGDYSKLVQAAIRTGTEIPEAMRPVLQDLVDMGLLVDENGEAFKDLSQITWAKSMTQGFDEVTKAIYELRDALLHGVGGAMDEISRKHVTVKVDYDTSGRPSGDVPEFASGTRGQFVDFGAGEYVKLHGREAVVTESDALGISGGDIYVSIGNREIRDYVVSTTREDAARGGLVPRTSARRRY